MKNEIINHKKGSVGGARVNWNGFIDLAFLGEHRKKSHTQKCFIALGSTTSFSPLLSPFLFSLWHEKNRQSPGFIFYDEEKMFVFIASILFKSSSQTFEEDFLNWGRLKFQISNRVKDTRNAFRGKQNRKIIQVETEYLKSGRKNRLFRCIFPPTDNLKRDHNNRLERKTLNLLSIHQVTNCVEGPRALSVWSLLEFLVSHYVKSNIVKSENCA